MTRLLLTFAFMFAFAATSDAGWLRDRIAAKRGNTCSDGTCSAVASTNGAGVTTTACANGKCDLPASFATLPATSPLAPKVIPASVDTIVIDGKAYRLTPIGPP